MGRKKPRCHRTECMSATSELKESDIWKHARLLFWGGTLQSFAVSGFSAGTIVLVFMFFMPSRYLDDDPHAPGYWEVALPVWGVLMGICFIPFIVAVIMNKRGKTIIKRDLFPARCQRCPKCFYDLSARPREIDICPECGTIASRRECVRLWCKLLRSRF